jgi:hypothetical protein
MAKIFPLDFAGIFKAVNNRLSVIAKKINFVKPYDYIFFFFLYGIVTIGYGYDIDMRFSRLININTVDFDRLIRIQGQEPLIEVRYAVFVDQYIPYDPDAIIINMATPPAELYYRELNIFFDLLEKQYELEVIIAAHPKALKYHEENPFNGRRIIFSKTPELIKDAQFMMTHYSTCVGIGALFKIPMVFLASELLKKYFPSYIFNLIKYFSDYFESEYIFYDQYKEKKINLTVNNLKYEEYKYNYMTSPESENKTTEEIFIQFINQN